EAMVGHLHDAHVGLDCAEGVVLRCRGLGGGEGVEQGRLADIGETDDAEAQHSLDPFPYPAGHRIHHLRHERLDLLDLLGRGLRGATAARSGRRSWTWWA